jgi:hypothetical protein
MLEARMRARERGLCAHRDVAGEQHAVGRDPDDRIAGRVVRTHGGQLGVHAAEIEVVVVLERDVRLAEGRALEQLGIDRGALGKNVRELQAELGDVLTWSRERISRVVAGKDWAPRSCSGCTWVVTR